MASGSGGAIVTTIVARNAFLGPVEERLAREFSVVRVAPGKEADIAQPELVKAIATNGYAKADKAFMDRFPNLAIIATMSAGVDHIDLAHARDRGIAVTNISDVHNECVADLGMGLIICATRGIVSGDRFVRAGKWKNGAAPLGRNLAGMTLGVLGLGKVGRLVAQRAEAFHMRIAYCNRRAVAGCPYSFVEKPIDLARMADILLLTAPATKETEKLVSTDILRALGPSGYLVNLARGSIVDDDALITAVREKTIAGAALDVVRNEPNIREEYYATEDIVIVPHIGSATVEIRTAMGMAMADNLTAFFAGRELPNRVTR
jgi:lactate dehydrogenase-like 2-hydroxyacid dehydrogenase